MSIHSSVTAFKKLVSFLTVRGRRRLLIISVGLFVVSFLEMMTAFIIALFAEALIYPQKAYHYLQKLHILSAYNKEHVVLCFAAITAGIYFFKLIIGTFSTLFSNRCIQSEAHTFKLKFLNLYSKMPYENYLGRNSADFISTMNGEADIIFSSGLYSIIQIFSELLVFLLLLIAVAFINPKFFLVLTILGGVISFVALKLVFPLSYKIGNELRTATRKCNRSALQFIHTFKDIILSTKLSYFLHEYNQNAKRKSNLDAYQLTFNSLPRLFLEAFFIVIFISVICYMTVTHHDTQKILVLLGGYLYAGFRFMPGMNRIVNFVSIFKSLIPAINHVYQEYTALGAVRHMQDSDSFSFSDSIIFMEVDFRYENTKKNVLNKVSLQIRKGECIGIVGATGSGKSTLIDLLLGLLNPTHGHISVDSIYPVNNVAWHENIGYVSQMIHLIDDTIATNITFGSNKVDDELLNKVIDEAQLTYLIRKLPDGVNTAVGDRGVRLSGGERQRIAIARALYRNPQVLIFDEATSALDNNTEEALMEVINKVSMSRTVIMVAHRLTTLKDCDRIFVMKEGRIVDEVVYEALQNQAIYT
jgi:ATP-binding cassette subfamily C protein